jgi:putative methyltransferase (TIGR04325 family)
MRLRAKDILRELIPPVLWRTLRNVLAPSANAGYSKGDFREWEYILEGWGYAKGHPEVKGWNVQEVLEVYKDKWPRFIAMVEGTGPLGIAHESDLNTNTDIKTHNTIMAFAYAIALAAHRLDTLSMLDWGGGIGHYYVIAQALLPHVRIDYHCKDVPILSEYGAQLFPDQHFYADESCLERTYNFVVASTSLHYTEDWQRLLAGVARATQGYLYVTNLPIVLKAPSFVFIQRPYAYGYNTEYLGWCFNRGEFVKYAETMGLKLVREFVMGYKPPIYLAPEQNEYRGFLFRSSGRDTN